jgi:hypothetical protein
MRQSHVQRNITATAVFLGSLAILSSGAGSAGLATAWVDPVARIQAQDEALYASISLGMVSTHHWLTPRFMGRLALFKPPLFYWLSAISAKVWGPSALALRVPSLLAGAGAVTIVFLWLAEESSLAVALTGALLAISSHMLFVLSRVALTDALLTFLTLLAVWTLARDRLLERNRSLWIFGLATGAAIMTKAVAGIFPLLVLVVLAFTRERPSVKRMVAVVAIAGAVAAPWHVYQIVTHPRWFWAEYVVTEHFVEGLAAPQQTTQETRVLFYLKRLVLLDPALVAAAAIALARKRLPAATALIAVIAIAVLAFQYRNAAYIMPMFPAFAVVAAGAVTARWGRLALGVAAVLFVTKAFFTSQPWGLPFAPEFVNPSYAPLASYAAQHRPRELIVVDPDDQFYSAALNLRKVRYVYLDPRTERPQAPLDFEWLGITVTTTQFAQMNGLMPVFAERLRAFDLDSTEPVASVILASDEREISTLLTAHPGIDFYIPLRWAPLDQGVHETRPATATRVLLLAR